MGHLVFQSGFGTAGSMSSGGAAAAYTSANYPSSGSSTEFHATPSRAPRNDVKCPDTGVINELRFFAGLMLMSFLNPRFG